MVRVSIVVVFVAVALCGCSDVSFGVAAAGGTAGFGGTAGVGGTSGAGGNSGTAGTGGTAGSDAGVGGTAGFGGTGGTSGAGGAGGKSGTAGAGGSAGSTGDLCKNGGFTNSKPSGCGKISPTGLWICYSLPHRAACGVVGLAGSNPPVGMPVSVYFNDPMVAIGKKCVAGNPASSFVLCGLPAPSGTTVEFAPGLHTLQGPTISGRFACDSVGCKGRAVVIKDGKIIGTMQNASTSGKLSFKIRNGRKDIVFTAP